ncbi:protein of unknown function [Candidatus Nitrosotalea okcheonensis]|uniref:Uncharacterized protein n=1 Tax=Candidatus Nitrosotalea okcheonensis TaxID=1903276 RepID=A0A2H1FDI0_9ARCH|nr:protein of unknown function [Candidatus Nitrosotalea okcheonensis]
MFTLNIQDTKLDCNIVKSIERLVAEDTGSRRLQRFGRLV